MLMSHGLVASHRLCKQDYIIPSHVSVKMLKRKQSFFSKKLRTEVESESTESATQSISILSEEQPGSPQDNESKQEKYEWKFQQLWLEKFTWLSYNSGKNVMHCNYVKIITGSMFLCSNFFIYFGKVLRSRLIVVNQKLQKYSSAPTES